MGDNLGRRCLNCGAELHKEGNYCHVCGQPASTGRLTTLNMGMTILSGVTRINGQFVKTFKNLLVRPWKVIAEYIRGRRASYIAPVQALLVVLFIWVALPAVFGIEHHSMKDHYGDKMLLSGDGALVSTVNYIFNHVITSETLLYILLLIPAIPLVRLTHRLAGVRKFNTAEYIVACLYLSCFILALSVALFAPVSVFGHFYESHSWIATVVKTLIIMSVLCVALYKSMASSPKGGFKKGLYVFFCFFLGLLLYSLLFAAIILIHQFSFGRL